MSSGTIIKNFVLILEQLKLNNNLEKQKPFEQPDDYGKYVIKCLNLEL